MTGTADTAQRQQTQEQGLVVALVTLPFRVFGVLCGSLLLSILIECIGLHLFWPQEGWHHAQDMLYFELEQLSAYFKKSALMREPGRTAQRVVEKTRQTVLVDSGALEWIQKQSTRARESNAGAAGVQRILSSVYANLETYLLAAFFTLLTFVVRLMVLLLTVPLFVIGAFVGLVDGLVRRDIRRFGAGRESGFIYHRAKASILPFLVLPWVVYLALPVSVQPLLILLPAAILLSLACNLAAGSFKKYL